MPLLAQTLSESLSDLFGGGGRRLISSDADDVNTNSNSLNNGSLHSVSHAKSNSPSHSYFPQHSHFSSFYLSDRQAKKGYIVMDGDDETPAWRDPTMQHYNQEYGFTPDAAYNAKSMSKRRQADLERKNWDNDSQFQYKPHLIKMYQSPGFELAEGDEIDNYTCNRAFEKKSDVFDAENIEKLKYPGAAFFTTVMTGGQGSGASRAAAAAELAKEEMYGGGGKSSTLQVEAGAEGKKSSTLEYQGDSVGNDRRNSGTLPHESDTDAKKSSTSYAESVGGTGDGNSIVSGGNSGPGQNINESPDSSAHNRASPKPNNNRRHLTSELFGFGEKKKDTRTIAEKQEASRQELAKKALEKQGINLFAKPKRAEMKRLRKNFKIHNVMKNQVMGQGLGDYLKSLLSLSKTPHEPHPGLRFKDEQLYVHLTLEDKLAKVVHWDAIFNMKDAQPNAGTLKKMLRKMTFGKFNPKPPDGRHILPTAVPISALQNKFLRICPLQTDLVPRIYTLTAQRWPPRNEVEDFIGKIIWQSQMSNEPDAPDLALKDWSKMKVELQ